MAEVVIHRACLIPLAGKPGKHSANVKPGDPRIVAVDDKGDVHANPATSVGGAFESFSLSADGNVAVFDESGPLARGIRVV